jgi:hypothetical protein
MRYSAIIKRAVKEIGWINTFLYYSNRILKAFLGSRVQIVKYYLLVQKVRDVSILSHSRGNNINVVEVSADNAVRNQFPHRDKIEFRYQQGAHCLCAYKNEEFIGYHWLSLGHYLDDNIRAKFLLLPEEKAAWNFDLYINPEHRLGFAFAKIWDETHKLRWSKYFGQPS